MTQIASRLILITTLNEWAKDKKRLGLFKCSCGVEKKLPISRVKNGVILSCGCYRDEKIGNLNKKHGLKKHPIYQAWSNMKKRCYNTKCDDYHNYGARGVRVCDLWKTDFMSFYNWCLANGWRRGLEVDKDIKGNGMLYSPETCLLVTKKQNANKRRNNHVIEWRGIRYNQIEIARMFNIPQKTLSERLMSGWSLMDAIYKPRKQRKIKKEIEIKHSFGYIN